MAKDQGPATSKDFFRGRDGKRGTDSHYGNAHGYGEGDNVHKGPGSKRGAVGTARTSAGGDAGSATEKTHNATFAEGGKTPMFSEQAAESETDNGMAGRTADPTAKDVAPGKQFASGGDGKMFGFNPAVRATAGITSAR